MSRRYFLFGLIFESDIPLPEAREEHGEGPADVSIRIGPLAGGPTSVSGLTRLAPDDDLLCIPGIARYRCSRGTDIRVEPCPGVPEQNVRLYLLGSVMGLLLHQRGLLPLHGSAVTLDGEAYVFVGPSGIGKSTLAAWFHDNGLSVLADDVALVDQSGEQARVQPGLSRLRLWRDAVEASGRATDDLGRSYAGDDQWDKFDVPLEVPVGGPVPLRAVLLIQEAPDWSVEPIHGIAAIDLLMSNVYRGRHQSEPRMIRQIMSSCLTLVSSVPVFRWSRPRRVDDIDASNGRLLAWLRQRQGSHREDPIRYSH